MPLTLPEKKPANTISLNAYCSTNGTGFWSSAKRNVKVLQIAVACVSKDQKFGELRASFDTSDWSTSELGLIYTDPLWIRDFRSLLERFGFTTAAANDVGYSEQGMQGDDYVSMDVGKPFLDEWFKLIKKRSH